MALTSTKLLNYIEVDHNLDAAEGRMRTVHGAIKCFRDDTAGLMNIDSLNQGRASEDRTVQYPVLQKLSFTAGSSRSCTGATAQSTSALVTPTWVTYTIGFDHTPVIYSDNYIQEQRDFNYKMMRMQSTILDDLDTAAVTHLNANKSQVNNADANPYSVVSSVMQVPVADNEDFFNELTAIMTQNDLDGTNVNVVATPRIAALIKHLNAQGVGNGENLSYQFGGQNFYYTRAITNATGDRDTVYAMPMGSLVFDHWIGPEYRAGRESGDGKEWGRMLLPVVNMEVELLFQSSCADKSGVLAGQEAAYTENYNFSFDYSFMSQYNSAPSTNPGVIYKAVFNKS